ncbi:hypothetical protein GWG65_17020 [Bradyrhizobium sp. CSA207]|uniref:hypothetical protein n=1 Tax=Bradyrhizobium sp. CSA207 TaxID=2698826 RepID=UPI0023B0D094|nr:hypothetical protein [Bradyrhizobium sp. CSA207]MDE5443127.1 hypothetical protein [Bradyrhizobium sp. CSA207]
MLDLIATIFATALYATVVGVLIGLSPARAMTRLVIFAAAAAWLALISAAAAFGSLAPGALGPLPATLLPFTGLLVLLFGSWYFSQVRSALLSVSLPALVAVHAGRLGGLFFLLLYWDGRLSAPFAPSAGIGDMITGALALPLAAMLALGFQIPKPWIVLWNAFGTLDLVVAIVLGLLSAPGTPFRVFTEGPGTLAMSTLPWAFVPSMLVPIYLFIHFAIAVKLKSLPGAAQATAMGALR